MTPSIHLRSGSAHALLRGTWCLFRRSLREGLMVAPLSLLVVVVAVGVLGSAGDARAVVISSGDGSGNTTAPVGDFGWSYVGAINGASGVYLGGSGGTGWVLTANHVGSGDFVTSDGQSYNSVANSGVQFGNSDLYAFQVAVGTGTGLSSLGNLNLAATAPVDGSALTMIGYGYDRSPVTTTWYVDTTPATWSWSTSEFNGWDSTFQGYQELSTSTKRWGTNLSSGVINYSGTSVIQTTFTTDPSHGAQGAGGDSGGGVFSVFGEGYQLSGIMMEISTYNNQPAYTAVASNSLQGNLTYSIDISAYANQINALTGLSPSSSSSSSSTSSGESTGGSSSGQNNSGTIVVTDSLVYDGSGKVIISESISGPGNVTQAGSGTTILAGTNSYSGGTFITAGTLGVGNGGTSGTLGSGSVVDNSSLVVNRSDAFTLGNAISGTGAFNQAGSGTTTLTGNNTYSGVTFISGGALQVGNGGTTGTLGSGDVWNYGSLVVNRSDAVTLGNAISGMGDVTQAGTGTTTLTGTNSFSGTASASAGELVVGSTHGLGSALLHYSTNMAFANGITNYTVGGLTGSNNFVMTNSGGSALALTVGNANQSAIYSGNLSDGVSGSGLGASLTKIGTGTQTLTGNNTYSGKTTVSEGTLEFANTGALYGGKFFGQNAAKLTVENGATAAFAVGGNKGFTAATLGYLLTLGSPGSGSTNVGFQNGSSLGIDASGTTFTYAYAIADPNNGANVLGLTLLGSGTTILTGNNSYTGTTTISGGTLQIGNGAPGDSRVGTLGSGAVVNNGTLLIDAHDVQMNLYNAISGTGSVIIKNSSGFSPVAQIMSGNNTYSGGTTISANLVTTSTNALGRGAVTLSGYGSELGISTNLTISSLIATGGSVISFLNPTSGSSLNITGAFTTVKKENEFSRGVYIAAGSEGTTLGNTPLQLMTWGSGSGNSITEDDFYLLNNHAAHIVINNALYVLDVEDLYFGSNSSGQSMVINSGTSYYENAYIGYHGSSNSVLVDASSAPASLRTTKDLLIGYYVGDSNNSVTVSGSNAFYGSQQGNIVVGQSGSGNSLVLSNGAVAKGLNSRIGVNSSASNNSVLVTGAGSTLNLTNEGNGVLIVGASGSGNSLVVSNGGRVNSLSSEVGVYAANNSVLVTGAESLWSNKATVEIKSSNGGVTVANGGTLKSSAIHAWDTSAPGIRIHNSSLNIGGFGTNDTAGIIITPSIRFGMFATGGAINFNQSDTATLGANISDSGNGRINQLGSGTSILTGDNSGFSGLTTISAGVLQVGNGGTNGNLGSSSVVNNTSLVVNRRDTLTLGNNISGSGSVIQAGVGMTVLSGSNSYSGKTMVSVGTLEFASTGALYAGNTSSWTAENLTVASNATAAFAVGGTNGFTSADLTQLSQLGNSDGGFQNGSSFGLDASGTNYTFSINLANTVNGALGLTLLGNGTTTLTGNNSYSGTTKISGGTLQVGDGGTTGIFGSGDVVNNASLVLNRSDAFTLGNTISGTGDVTQAGAGTTTLTASNSFTGTASASAGQLVVGSAYGLGSALVNYSSKVAFADGITGYTVGGLTGSNNLAMTNSGGSALALSVGNANQSALYSGNLSDGVSESGLGASLTKVGTGLQLLSGSNSYSGPTTISGGALQIGIGGTNGTLGSGNVINDANLIVWKSDTLTLSNPISGSGNLIQAGSGTTILTGANTYTGKTAVNDGTLRVGSENALGATSAVNLNQGTLSFASTLTVSSLAWNSAGALSIDTLTPGALTVTGGLALSGADSHVINLASGTLGAVPTSLISWGTNSGSNAITARDFSVGGQGNILLKVTNNTLNISALGTNSVILRNGDAIGASKNIGNDITLSAGATIQIKNNISADLLAKQELQQAEYDELLAATIRKAGFVANVLQANFIAGTATEADTAALIRINAAYLGKEAQQGTWVTNAKTGGQVFVYDRHESTTTTFSEKDLALNAQSSQQLNDVMNGFVPLNDAEFERYKSLQETFGSEEALVLVELARQGDARTQAALAAQAAEAARAAQAVQAVQAVQAAQAAQAARAAQAHNPYETDTSFLSSGLQDSSATVVGSASIASILGATTVTTPTPATQTTQFGYQNGIVSPAPSVQVTVDFTPSAYTNSNSTRPLIIQGVGGVGDVNVLLSGTANQALSDLDQTLTKVVVGSTKSYRDLVTSGSTRDYGIVVGSGLEINTVSAPNFNFSAVVGETSTEITGTTTSYEVRKLGTDISYDTSYQVQSTVTTNKAIRTTNIPKVQYVPLDNGNALVYAKNSVEAQVAILYHTMFGKEADVGGLDYWFDVAKGGATLKQIATAFANSSEGQTAWGGLSNEAFIQRMYQNTFHRAGESAGVSYWLDQIMNTGATRAGIALQFSQMAIGQTDTTPSVNVTAQVVGSVEVVTGIISPGSWPEGTTGGQLIVTGGANFNNAIAVSTPGWELVIDGGTTTLNASNSYNGSTMIINGATLVAAKGNALPTNYGGTPIFLDQDSSGTSWGTGYSTLALPVAQTIASLSGRVSSLVNLAGYTLTIGTDGATNTYAGTIIDGLVDSWYGYGPGSLVKVGNSTQILTGNSRYSGTTTISGGTLQIGNGGTTGTLGSGAVTNNGTLVVKRSDAFTLANTISGSGTFTQAGAGTTTLIGTNSGFSGLTKISAGALQYGNGSTAGTSVSTGGFINNGVLAFNPTSTDNYTVAGNISGTGSVNLLGSGTTTLSGSNSYAGGTTISAGAVQVTSGNALGTGGLTIASSLLSPATLMYAGTGVMTLSNDIHLAGAEPSATIFNEAGASIFRFSSALTLQGGSNGIALSGTISGTCGIFIYGGTTTLSGDNFYSGTTTILDGTLQIGDGGTTGSIGSKVVYNNGSLVVNRSDAFTLANNISGWGSFIQAGTGTTTLTGTNSFSGTASASAGQLVVGSVRGLGSALLHYSTNVAFANGITNYTLGGLTGSNNFAMRNAGGSALALTLDITGQPATYSGNMSGEGASVTKTGWGVQTLVGNNTYTGKTTVSAGTLVFGNAGALYGGNTSSWTAENLTVASGATAAFAVGGDNPFTSANITQLSQLGNSYGGFQNGSSLGIDASGTTFTYGGVIADPNNGANALGLTLLGSGTTILTENNSYTGTTTISGGTLQIGDGGTTGTLGSGSVWNNNASLVVNRSDAFTLGNTISGYGAFTQAGAGTTILTGDNSGFWGVTTISGGALQVGNGGTSGTLGWVAVVNNGSLVVNRSDAFTLGNTISGAGNLIQAGVGTTTLSGANTYSGTTTISGGTLSLGTTGNLSGTTGVSVSTGSTLLLGSANQINTAANLALVGGTLSMGGNGLTRASEQTFGTLTLTANSVIDFANLTGNSSLTFSSIVGLSANSLSIWNWSSAEGSATRLNYASEGLSAGDLANISFYSGSGTGLMGKGSFYGSEITPEIVPVPEPSVVMTGLLLLGALAYGFRRKKKMA
ncbi:MAG: autotransporter-associated beta strand repeat-containing protein [Verrucomicrobia bacterium]|nr:autotransporter-associated beta strand repeat-containing protein [Verrucomicrobiota bacterium]